MARVTSGRPRRAVHRRRVLHVGQRPGGATNARLHPDPARPPPAPRSVNRSRTRPGGILDQQPPGLDDRHAVGGALDFREHVGRQENAPSAITFAHDDFAAPHGCRWDRGPRRVVQDQHRRIVQQARARPSFCCRPRDRWTARSSACDRPGCISSSTVAMRWAARSTRYRRAKKRRYSSTLTSSYRYWLSETAPTRRLVARLPRLTRSPAIRASPPSASEDAQQHQNGGRFAGSVRAEKAVDLAASALSERSPPPGASRSVW